VTNIVVIGGGLSGWLAALYAKWVSPDNHVGVVYSEEIGILGAGEGSVPSLLSLFNYLDLDVDELISKTNASIKNGIRYIGWSEGNPDYFHAFDPEFKRLDLSHKSFKNYFYTQPSVYPLYLENLYYNQHVDQFNFMSRLSRYNKIPITKEGNKLSNYGIHFDASLITKYLKDKGFEREIRHYDKNVSDFSYDENGNIDSVIFDNGEKVNADFIFDCTGLHRLIIGKHLDSEWISFEEYLPMKKAIPFSINSQKPFPHTGAIAMDYGWMWQIPLQHRIGSGYVFDSNLIDEDQAKKELNEKAGYEVDTGKTFNINPGVYKDVWVKNVVAIGLSAGFLEPLEASSIWIFTRALERFFKDKNNIKGNSEFDRKIFNQAHLKDMEDVRDFIHLHYITDKTNTVFWKDFLNNYKTPEFVENILEIINHRPPYEQELLADGRMYWDSYYPIIFGNNIINKESFNNYYKNNDYVDTELPWHYNRLIADQEKASRECITLEEYLEGINLA
jgi:tryptophan halogenase